MSDQIPPKQSKFRPYLIRLGIILLFSTLAALLINEVTFRFLNEGSDRAPTTVQLVIPAGTAEKIAAGEDIPTIPDQMKFVVGDILEVKNEDNVPHELGPVLVPPGATGTLMMQQEARLAYSCSFQSSQYLGVDIRPATTIGTRLVGLFLAAPTLTALLFVYSLAIWPVGKPRKTSSQNQETP